MTAGPYAVEFSSAAKRSLRRLPSRIVHAIVEFIAGPLAENPERLSKPLRNELEGARSARRGDYRVLLRIDEAQHCILVLDINHRAHIYRT